MNTKDGLVWTHDLPKEVGVYWCRITEKKEDSRLCIVIRRDGQFVVCQTRETECGTPLKWFIPQYTEWCGPLNPPTEKKAEICPVCHHPSSSVNCHKWWEGV